MANIEHCTKCDEPTGHAGVDEDSIYFDDDGPFCDKCAEELTQQEKVDFSRSE